MAGEVWAIRPGFFGGDPDGPTVMDLASGPGLLRSLRRRLDEGRESVLAGVELDTRIFLKAAMAGDEVALETLEAGRDAVAGLLITVIEVMAPAAIVLAGGLCTDNAWFLDPVRRRIREWTEISRLRSIPLYRAELWDNAVLYGAVRLVRDLE